MSVALMTVAAATVAWLVWRLIAPPPKLNMPHVKFEGDNSMARYRAETRTLMEQGYNKVSHPWSLAYLLSFIYLTTSTVYRKRAGIFHSQCLQPQTPDSGPAIEISRRSQKRTADRPELSSLFKAGEYLPAPSTTLDLTAFYIPLSLSTLVGRHKQMR